MFVDYISCTPRYTDAAGSWLTNESLYAFSIWFNPRQDLSLEDLAKTIEKNYHMLMSPRAHFYAIHIVRFAICGQDYPRQDLPNYRAADILRDKETFNAAWVKAGQLGRPSEPNAPGYRGEDCCTIL